LVWEGKRYLLRHFEQLGLEAIYSAANFILFKVNKDGLTISQELLKRGVIVRDMCQYGLKDYVRVTVGTKQENEKFVEALRKVL